MNFRPLLTFLAFFAVSQVRAALTIAGDGNAPVTTSPNPANYYSGFIQSTATKGQAENVGPSLVSAQLGARTFTPSTCSTGATLGAMLIIGYSKYGKYDSTFVAQYWFEWVDSASGQDSRYGVFVGDTATDNNGIMWDLSSGNEVPGQSPKLRAELTNPFTDRGYTYDIEVLDGSGNVVSVRSVNLAPGETRVETFGNNGGGPFSVRVYDVVEGVRGQTPFKVLSSTGGASGTGGTPTSTGSFNRGAVNYSPPTVTATGETQTATQNAVNRLTTVVSETSNRYLDAMSDLRNQIRTGNEGIISAIGSSGSGSGSGLTQAQVQAAVTDAANSLSASSSFDSGSSDTLVTEMQNRILDGQAATSSIGQSQQTLRGGMSSITAWFQGQSVQTGSLTDLDQQIPLPYFGTLNISFSPYLPLASGLRALALFGLLLALGFAFIKITRSAFA